MEAEARYTYVGVAVIGLVVALVATVVWLKQFGTRDQFRYYTVYFEHTPLDGLQIGADVEMRGIKVGRVEDYALQTDNINRVQVTVRADRRTPVSDNTRATLSRNYVTGIARISLVTQGQPGPALTQIPSGERYPVIGEGRSDFEQLRVNLASLGEQAALALEAINQTLGADNRKALSQALTSVHTLADGVTQRLAKLDGAVAMFNLSSATLSQSSNRVATAAENLERDFAPAIDQARRSLADAAATFAAMQNDSAKLMHRLDAVARSTEDQFTIAVSELRTSLESIARVLERWEDPRAALLGPTEAQLGPGERLR